MLKNPSLLQSDIDWKFTNIGYCLKRLLVTEIKPSSVLI